MMKFLYGASVIFTVMSMEPVVLADSMKCRVISGLGENETGVLAVDYRQVGADRWITSSIDLHVISDGTSTSRLFDSMNRGGNEVVYCSPNDNEYSRFSQTFSLYSHCTAKEPLQKVIFHASLSTAKSGFLKSHAFYESGELVSREIEVGICE